MRFSSRIAFSILPSNSVLLRNILNDEKISMLYDDSWFVHNNRIMNEFGTNAKPSMFQEYHHNCLCTVKHHHSIWDMRVCPSYSSEMQLSKNCAIMYITYWVLQADHWFEGLPFQCKDVSQQHLSSVNGYCLRVGLRCRAIEWTFLACDSEWNKKFQLPNFYWAIDQDQTTNIMYANHNNI